MKYAAKRRTFGKKLMDHPVIRWKLAEMARQIECTHAMLETLTYQMDHMSKEEQNSLLGGDTALIKVRATRQTRDQSCLRSPRLFLCPGRCDPSC